MVGPATFGGGVADSFQHGAPTRRAPGVGVEFTPGTSTTVICTSANWSRVQIATAIANASELVAELTAMNRLHQLSTRLLLETELQPLLEEVLNATMALQGADFGNFNSTIQELRRWRS